MPANSKSLLSCYDILARSNIKQHDFILCIHKTSKEYMTAEISPQTRKLITVKKFQSSTPAYQDYFSRLGTPLNLNKQSLSLLLITPEIELEDTASQHMKLQTPKKISQQGSTPELLYDRRLIPSCFYTQRRVPEWLEATRTMKLLNSGIEIHTGEQYRILAMDLKPNAKETESTIHLASPYGQLIQISLSVACSCFLRGHKPNQHNNLP